MTRAPRSGPSPHDLEGCKELNVRRLYLLRVLARLLLGVGLVWLLCWVVSLLWWPKARWGGVQSAQLQRGGLMWMTYRDPRPSALEWPRARWPNPQYWWIEKAGAPSVSWLTIPLWMPLVAFGGAGGAVWAWERRSRRLLKADPNLGECLGCGYARRGLSPTDMCPECGAARGDLRPPAATV